MITTKFRAKVLLIYEKSKYFVIFLHITVAISDLIITFAMIFAKILFG